MKDKMNWILLAVPLRMTSQKASNAFGWFQCVCPRCGECTNLFTREQELLYGENSLLSNFGPLVAEICSHNGVYYVGRHVYKTPNTVC